MIVWALMLTTMIFITEEFSRHDSANLATYHAFKASAVAANIMQYNDLMVQYMLANYDVLHLTLTSNSGNVEQINWLDYEQDNISNYSQKNLLRFLNYEAVVFNYINPLIYESQNTPILYLASSWDTYTPEVVKGYSTTQMLEVMGQLGQDMSKRLYQGNSTYWTVPWVFSQSKCNIIEMFSQLPDDANGISTLNKLQSMFNLFCTQIESKSDYRFLTYVYMQPVVKVSDI